MDFLKGVACVFMLIAHFPVYDKTDTAALILTWIASPATALFFGISGLNITSQLKKYTLSSLLSVYAVLCFFGIAYSAVVHPNIYERFLLEIFQIIAIGAMLVAITGRMLGTQNWIFALIAAFIVMAKFLFDLLAPDFHGAGILLTHENYLPHSELPQGTKKFFPGFPILPWIFTFFWGVAIYQASTRLHLMILITTTAGVIATQYFGFGGDWREKWDMSLAYLLFTLAYFSLHVVVVRLLPEKLFERFSIITEFGRQSLIFLFVHGFGLLAGMSLVKTIGQWPALILAFIVTYVGMKLVLKWKGFSNFNHTITWVGLAILITTLPILNLYHPKYIALVTLSEVLLGLLFAKHFPQLRLRILKTHRTPQ
jgi:hypothetical protein